MANEFGNLGTLSPEDYQQQQAITRQQRMAEMLMQNNQAPQGQMVSGRYVSPSFFQYITPLVNAYVGKNLLEEGDVKAAKLAEAIRGRNATEAQDIIQTLQGTSNYKPAEMPQIQRDDMGNVMPAIEQQVGKAPDKQAALMKALKSTSPIGQMVANSLITKSLEGPKFHNVASGASLLQETPEGIKSVFTNPKEIETPNEIKSAAFRLGFNSNPSTWTPDQIKLIDDKVRQDKLEGRTVTNVNVPVNVTTQKAYGQEFGGLMAKQDVDKYTIAQAAPKILQQSMQIKDLLNKGAFTGTGADFALSASKVLNVAGANNAEKIKNTELLVSSLGQNVLNNIKTSGLGAGQGFTDKDRQFLERVVGGQIALDKTTLTQLANLQEKAAKASLSQWNDRFKTMPKEVIQATGISPVYMPMNTNSNDVFSAADAIVNNTQGR
jgi:hypothetical protein